MQLHKPEVITGSVSVRQVFLKVTMAAELGDDIVPEVMSVFTAESFATALAPPGT